MTAIEIHLGPEANLGIFEVLVVDGVLAPEVCDEIRSRAVTVAWRPGHEPVDRGATWVSQPLPCRPDQTPVPQVAAVLGELNATRFRVSAEELAAHDPPLVVRYSAGCTGRTPALGLSPELSTRKLGFLLALGDRSAIGGHPVVAGKEYELAPGAMIVFPALSQVGMSGVKQGRREFLEGWLHGPAWR